MTQASLNYEPVERLSLCDKLEAYFKRHQGQWIDGRELAGIAGSYGWRTRVSDLRKRGMTIENRQRTFHRPTVFKVSEYRYVPEGQ